MADELVKANEEALAEASQEEQTYLQEIERVEKEEAENNINTEDELAVIEGCERYLGECNFVLDSVFRFRAYIYFLEIPSEKSSFVL